MTDKQWERIAIPIMRLWVSGATGLQHFWRCCIKRYALNHRGWSSGTSFGS